MTASQKGLKIADLFYHIQNVNLHAKNKTPYTSDRARDHGKESDPKVGHAE